MSVRSSLKEMLLQLMEAEKAQTSSDASRQYYVDLHKARFVALLHLCRSYIANPSARVLDIGRSEFTAYLLKLYSNVTTLGIDLNTDDGGHRELSRMEAVPHIAFDLLNSHRVDEWPEAGAFDLIVFSEVLEYLSVAPAFVFAFLNSLLADNGILICTTPNAADIAKRVRSACGAIRSNASDFIQPILGISGNTHGTNFAISHKVSDSNVFATVISIGLRVWAEAESRLPA